MQLGGKTFPGKMASEPGPKGEGLQPGLEAREVDAEQEVGSEEGGHLRQRMSWLCVGGNLELMKTS